MVLITNEEIHVDYLDHKTQNEFIHLLMMLNLKLLRKKIKRAEYFVCHLHLIILYY
jgi:hypothetical protein